MVRLEAAMVELQKGMEPVQELPKVVAVLERMEGLMERLVAAQEADAGVVVKPQRAASRRAAPRGRAASA